MNIDYILEDRSSPAAAATRCSLLGDQVFLSLDADQGPQQRVTIYRRVNAVERELRGSSSCSESRRQPSWVDQRTLSILCAVSSL